MNTVMIFSLTLAFYRHRCIFSISPQFIISVTFKRAIVRLSQLNAHFIPMNYLVWGIIYACMDTCLKTYLQQKHRLLY